MLQRVIRVEQPGPDVAYAVALTAGVTYTFTMTPDVPSTDPLAVDLGIALVGPGTNTVCSAAITACVAGFDEGYEGAAETFSYTVPSTGTGTYYVIVDSYNRDDGGAFSLAISTP